MPLKVWAPYDRLDAADLNANFSLVAAGQMPGVYSGAVGAAATVTVAGGWTDLAPATPTIDAGGFWNATTKRAVIPAGLGGLYLVVSTLGIAATGNPNLVSVRNTGAGANFAASAPRSAAGTIILQAMSLLNIGVGTGVCPAAQAFVADATVTVYSFSLIRLARGIEVIGS